MTDPGPTTRSTARAFGLGALVVAEVATGAVGSVLAGFDLAAARDSFVLTNSAIALSCAVAGVLIAWQRPRNAVGALLLAAALLQGATAATAPLVSAALAGAQPLAPVARTLATVAGYAWPWSIAVCLPVALLLFPDGHLPSRRWRPVLGLVALNGVLFALSAGADPAGSIGQAVPWLVLPDYATLAPLWAGTEILNGLVYLAALAALVLRYRRGDELRRRQLLWLLLALLAMLVMLLVWSPAADESGQLVLVLLVIPLVPAAITVAILRHQLLDIRLVLSRAVLYVLLSAAAAGAYVLLVAAADLLLRREAGLGSSVVATIVVALGFNPLRVRMQRVVDRALYGDRADPVRAVARLGDRLSAGAEPVDALAPVREALRLPWAALRVGGVEIARDGAAGEGRHEEVPLIFGGERVGELIVGVRRGQAALAPADAAVLELLAVPLAMAVRATALSASLQRSRSGIVTAREEERRRLRRDLHDGLGPVLTGVAFQADAAGNLLRSDPDRASALLTGLRERTAEAIADVRRLVHELRPPALDELGLVGALRRHVDDLDGVELDVPEPLPELPAAVEVVAYRIALEAVTNALRHASGTRVVVRLGVVDCALRVGVLDDGADRGPWPPGVGLGSMQERAAELGGDIEAGPGPRGGRVAAVLPLAAP